MKFKACIVTPTYNKDDFTIRCFDSIRKNTDNYKIIWIDNGSTTKSRQRVKKFLEENKIPHGTILNDENLGFVKATNQGMKRALESGVPYVVLQNNDTEVYDGWLERMIEVAESDPHIGLVGPITSPCESWQSIDNLKIKLPEFSNLPKYLANPEEYSKKIRQLYKNQTREISSMVAFFSTLMKNEMVRQIGLLSEEFGIGFGDDDDYCSRARQAKWKIILAEDIFVFHNHRTTFRANFSDKEIKKMQERNLTIVKKNQSLKQRLSSCAIPKLADKFKKLKGFNLYYIANLLRKACFVLRRQGIKTFLRYAYKYLIHGREYFK